jgi:hypothetical protein
MQLKWTEMKSREPKRTRNTDLSKKLALYLNFCSIAANRKKAYFVPATNLAARDPLLPTEATDRKAQKLEVSHDVSGRCNP